MNRRTVLKSLAAGGLAGRYAIGSPADMAEEKLWVGDDPELKEAPYVPGIRHVMVHRAQKGEYQYLHGPQIIAFKGVLFTSWANSLINENSSSEAQRGRRSKDGGKTWSKVEVIAPMGYPLAWTTRYMLWSDLELPPTSRRYGTGSTCTAF